MSDAMTIAIELQRHERERGDRYFEETCQLHRKLLEMAHLAKLARVECMHPRSVQARLLDEAIRMVDPDWQGAAGHAGRFETNGTKAAPKPWVAEPICGEWCGPCATSIKGHK